MENHLFFVIVTAALIGGPRDLAAWLDPADYFAFHQVPVTVDRMQTIASSQATDGASAMQRLLAIRLLGEHADPGNRETLRQLADGPAPSDSLDLTHEYARRALATLDGKPGPPSSAAGPAKREWLRWFPAEITFAEGLDLTVQWFTKPFQPKSFVPGSPTPSVESISWKKQDLYDFVDRVGNIRLHRIVVGVSHPNGIDGGERRIIRLTGLVDHVKLREYLRTQLQPCTVRRDSDAGEQVTSITTPNREAVLLIGNSELILIVDDASPTTPYAMVKQVLEVRAGKHPSVFQASLNDELQHLPDRFHAFVVGQTPPAGVQLASSAKARLDWPPRLSFSAIVNKQIQLQFWGQWAEADQARAFVLAADQSRTEMVEELNQFLPAPALASLSRTLKGIELQVNGKEVRGQGTLTGEELGALAELTDRKIDLAMGAAIIDGLHDLSDSLSRLVLGVGAGICVCLIFVLILAIARSRRSRPAMADEERCQGPTRPV